MGRKKRRSKINYIYQGPKIEYIYNTDFNLEIKKSNIKNAGLGVFSKEFIQKNTLLGEYRNIHYTILVLGNKMFFGVFESIFFLC